MKAGSFRLYPYVGDARLLTLPPTERTPVAGPQDLSRWRQSHVSDLDREGYVAATYILDEDSHLWLAHRRTEHVACARGGPVLAAGEIFLGDVPEIGRITNQSTGYCPSVDCWETLSGYLIALGITCPEGFDPAFEFRKCSQCQQIQLVRDAYFFCQHCDAVLDLSWNVV